MNRKLIFELALRLNILQNQMHTELRHNMTLRLPISRTVQDWTAELRQIELRLRAIPIVSPPLRDALGPIPPKARC